MQIEIYRYRKPAGICPRCGGTLWDEGDDAAGSYGIFCENCDYYEL